jgi:hypothetical protein
MDDEAKLINELLDSLIKYTTDPGEIHVCPICNGELHVWFGGYKRFEESLFGVQIKCDACGIQMAVDYGIPPSWVKTNNSNLDDI